MRGRRGKDGGGGYKPEGEDVVGALPAAAAAAAVTAVTAVSPSEDAHDPCEYTRLEQRADTWLLLSLNTAAH